MDLNIEGLSAFCCIMDFGKGSKALKLAKRLGAVGGTIFLGRGTVKSEILNILGLMEVRREIFLTIIDDKLEDEFYNEMANKFRLDKTHHGVAFSIPLKSCIEINDSKHALNTGKKDVKDVDYEAIFTIVDKGLSERVLDAAGEAGSTGGTVIHGRGSGTSEKEKLFDIEIEPEKDIILILCQSNKTEAVVNSIRKGLRIDEVGRGIVFVLDVTRTLGLYKKG